MEEKEDLKPTIQNNNLTRPLIFSIVGASLGFLQYGYAFSLITNPIVIKMQLMNLQNEGTNTSAVHLGFLVLFSILIPLGGLFGMYLWSCLADRYGRYWHTLSRISGLWLYNKVPNFWAVSVGIGAIYWHVK